MARRTKAKKKDDEPKKGKGAVLNLRLSAEEKAKFSEAAAKLGLGLSGFLRMAALEKIDASRKGA